jgi:riboflavin kinase/FMN adenylyltransferase
LRSWDWGKVEHNGQGSFNLAIVLLRNFTEIKPVWVTSSLSQVLTPTSIALGNFDGIHRGHHQVIKAIATPEDGYRTVVSFTPHPYQFFSGQTRDLLTPLPEKVRELERLGVQQLVLLPFNCELSQLTPEAFFEEILQERLQTQSISVGADFCFGRDRAGTVELLQRLGEEHGVAVTVTPLQSDHSLRISSSAIREGLASGKVDLVSSLLGRPYSLEGRVMVGQQLGRTIGFPTANLEVTGDKLLPKLGVYGVRVAILGRKPKFSWPTGDEMKEAAMDCADLALPEDLTWHQGVMNVGIRPTVQQDQIIVPEIHIFDWEKDLYGRYVIVKLDYFLRPEQKFKSLNDLKQQIIKDCDRARSLGSNIDVRIG